MRTRFTIYIDGTAPLEKYQDLMGQWIGMFDFAPPYEDAAVECGPARLAGSRCVEVHYRGRERELRFKVGADGACVNDRVGNLGALAHMRRVAEKIIADGLTIGFMRIDFNPPPSATQK